MASRNFYFGDPHPPRRGGYGPPKFCNLVFFTKTCWVHFGQERVILEGSEHQAHKTSPLRCVRNWKKIWTRQWPFWPLLTVKRSDFRFFGQNLLKESFFGIDIQKQVCPTFWGGHFITYALSASGAPFGRYAPPKARFLTFFRKISVFAP